jgi:DNA-binding CsgD family transcriptional regulator/tetratricopeptide (TPR) repeat protein
VLIGRDRELAGLRSLLPGVSAGRGEIVVVSGEAGIGKSALAGELVADCADRGFVVFCAAADEVERRRPFGVVLDALGVHRQSSGERAGIVGLLAEGGADGPGGRLGLEARIADLLTGLVAEACERGPVVVVLDDLQWADESSLMTVSGIARLVGSHPLLLVCIRRPYPLDTPLRSLLASLDYRRASPVDLGGLEPDEVEALAARFSVGPLGSSVRALLKEAGGNPFYVSELMRCLLAEAGDWAASGQALELTGVPPSFGLATLEELRFLPAPTLEVLRAAAVVGRSFSVGDVAMISPGSVGDAVGALGPSLQAGVVVADGERLSFRHDLVREAIYGDLAPAIRRGLHRDLASKLAASGAGPERVAAHVMLGADRGDVEAIGWLRRAAGEVRASSPAIAAELLCRALELTEGTTPGRTDVLAELVRPLLWTGQAAKAAEVCTEGLAAEPSVEEAPLFWLGLVTAQIVGGRFADARTTAVEALSCEELTESDCLVLATSRALCGVQLGDPEAWEAAREIAATAPRSMSRGTAQDVVAQWELVTGHADRALAAYEQVDSMVAPPEVENRIWQGSRVRIRMWEALALLDLDRIDEAVDLLRADLAALVAVPGVPHAFLAACHYHAGRFADAIEECEAAVRGAEAARSFVPASAPSLAATIALRQGRTEDCERLLAVAERVAAPAEAAGDTIWRWARTLFLEASGQADAAADAAGGALEAYQRAGFASYVAWHAPDLVRVCLRAGRAEQARLVVEAAEHVAAELPVASRRSGALRARGLLDGDNTRLLEALTAARQAGRPVDLAVALRDAAVALAGDGDKAAARPLAGEALDLLSTLGATGDHRRALQLLRRAGLSFGARTRHTRATEGWDSLTSAEHRVVGLVAEGRSNQQIARALSLSPRTVGWHLSNVFRKLSVSSRSQLVAALAKRDVG